MSVVFVRGIPDDRFVEVEYLGKDIIYNTFGNSLVYGHLKDLPFPISLLTLELLNEKKYDLKKYKLIFNQIADADTHKKALFQGEKIIEESQLPVINHPKYIEGTSRDKIYMSLKDIKNLHIPKTVRFSPLTPEDIIKEIKKENFKLPVIIRECGTHGGISMKLIKSFEEIFTLYSLALDGREYYLTQFIDYRDERGFYNKMRIVIIGDDIICKHMITSSTQWCINTNVREVFFRNNEMTFLENFDKKIKPLILERIEKIKEVIKLDYFGIDCILDGSGDLVVFELNAYMHFSMVEVNYEIAPSRKIIDSFKKLVINKLIG